MLHHACFVLLPAVAFAEQAWSSQVTLWPSPAAPHLLRPPATCPSGSVNYITHSLPQQCLRSGHSASAPHATATSDANRDPSQATNASAYSDRSLSTSTTFSIADSSDTSASPDSSTTEPLNASPISQADPSTTSTSTEAPTSTTSSDVATEQLAADAESPLDNAKFLSFEEWKQQNLADTGQSAETLGRKQEPAGSGSERRRPGGVHNALDSLGDDGEIEIDFSGFGSATAKQSDPQNDTVGEPSATNAAFGNAGVPASRARSKDAGRTCEERFNYASFDCAANVLKTNPQCKSSSSILVENKDSYLLNECAAENKFLIVELCDHIQIDTVVLANFEFFSSMFRTFRLSISDRYPVKIDRWRELGVYEARNSREIQAFLVHNPLIWARYLRIEFLTHYGSEYYCPLSLVRVHGTTMMEDYRHQEELARGEVDVMDDETELEGEQHLTVTGTAPPQAAESANATEVSVLSFDADEQVLQGSKTTHGVTEHLTSSTEICPRELTFPSVKLDAADAMCSRDIPIPSSTAAMSASALTTEPEVVASSKVTTDSPPGKEVKAAFNSTVAQINQTSACSTSVGSSSSSAAAAGQSTSVQPSTNQTSTSITSSPRVTASQTSSDAVMSHAPTGPSHPPQSTPAQPPTQESFFKSVHKRLLALEANATLSLQYIESQSQLLREAFSAVEKRQLAKTSTFLETLNSTVFAELTRARADYEQLWQSTVLELASQRDEGRREREILTERVRLLADEMVGQKRMMAAQATLLLLCLGLVVFAKFAGPATSASDTSADLGLLQSFQDMVNRRGGARLAAVKSSGDLLSRKVWGGIESPQSGSAWGSPSQSRVGTRPSTATLDSKPLPPAPPGAESDQAEFEGKPGYQSSSSSRADDEDDSPALEMWKDPLAAQQPQESALLRRRRQTITRRRTGSSRQRSSKTPSDSPTPSSEDGGHLSPRDSCEGDMHLMVPKAAARPLTTEQRGTRSAPTTPRSEERDGIAVMGRARLMTPAVATDRGPAGDSGAGSSPDWSSGGGSGDLG